MSTDIWERGREEEPGPDGRIERGIPRDEQGYDGTETAELEASGEAGQPRRTVEEQVNRIFFERVFCNLWS